MRWCVTGPRNLEGVDGAILTQQANDFMERLDYLDSSDQLPIVLNGFADGIDKLIGGLCDARGVAKKQYPVTKEDWRTYGKRAGILRNTEMVDAADVVVGFWNGTSRGTKNCIEQALAASKLAMVYFSTGVTWLSDYGWSPLDYAERIHLNRADIAIVLADRLKKNARNTAFWREDGSLDDPRLRFADDRAWDAAVWLMDNAVQYEWNDAEHLGQAVFPSKSRKKIKHYATQRTCTCEGWTIQRRPCIHMFILWHNAMRLQLIEKELTHATVTE